MFWQVATFILSALNLIMFIILLREAHKTNKKL